jgi:6-phosphogluconolactonase
MAALSIEVLPDADAVARRGADLFALAAQEAAAARPAFTAALSGGHAPRPLYALLARQQFAQKIPWRRVHLYWGDERCVPHDSKDSNYGMAHEAFIRHVPIPDDNVHRMRGEDDPDEAAAAYERLLSQPPALAATSQADLPVIDFVFLGIGPDGHTASLFPRSAALAVEDRLVVVNEGEGTGKRLTVTYPVINAARRVLFVVTGAAKAGMVAEVIEGLHVPEAIPAQGVAPVHGTLTWLLDQPAAGELSERARGA